MSSLCSKSYKLTINSSFPSPSAYWKFEEPGAGPFIDSIGGIQLPVQIGLPVSGPGIINNGIMTPGPAQQYFGWGGFLIETPHPSAALAYNATGGMTIAYWFKVPPYNPVTDPYTPAFFNFIPIDLASLGPGFGGAITTLFQYPLGFGPSGTTGWLSHLYDFTPDLIAWQPSASFPWADNAWHLFVAMYETATGTVKYRIDQGAWVPNNTSLSPVGFTGSATATFPAWAGASVNLSTSGPAFPTANQWVDELGIWMNRALTDAECDYLWNGGLGRTFP